MAITVNLRYTGKNGNARKFAKEMTTSGTVAAIRSEPGNLRYEYYLSLDDPETVLLIDSWENQAAIDAKVIMGTLGHKVFEPINKPVITISPTSDESVSDDVIELHLERTIKNVGKVEANGTQTSEGFVVLQGSSISPVDDDTVPAVIKERRAKAQFDENHILQEDLLFSSPSYAAMFVIGKRANGLTSWKTADGKTLKSLESEQT